MMSKKYFQISFWLFLAGVLYLSLSPVTGVPVIKNGDKIGHAISYALLFALAVKSYNARFELWLLAAGTMVFGMLMEWAQSYTGYRHADPLDMIANGSGILIMWLLVILSRKVKGQ
ncbi:VanZ family protein [Porticoccaceae bacterium]|jgi:VanZ family protein|nr:VanZ family protein [Porticoccaceae bacterium]MDC1477476.1 VanZ family protein [Porticoccaceae bacterium]CAI8329049.1 MAG: Uncharacterised protein [SAR92 bacterium MED-G29]